MNWKKVKMSSTRLLIFFIGIFFARVPVLSQSNETNPETEKNFFDLTLEELMNITIKSASQKEENLFDAPVDSYSITKERIKQSGVTSIPEALRLAPGVIVREISNGNYDIHLRGFDNLARYSLVQAQPNLLTLVMIDDRPVFDYGNGGTNWESLPIDLADVERIEIVKGPNSPLFGPNAVTGVINIITKKDKEDLHLESNLSYGSPNTTIANLRLGKKLDNNLDFTISGNYQKRERTDDLYYLYEYQAYSSNIDTAFNFLSSYKQSDLALEKYGINAFINYQKTDDISFRLSGGYQNADVQKYHFNFNFTSLSPSSGHNSYLAFEGNYKGLGTRFSITDGYGNFSKNSTLIATEFEYTNVNFVLNYDWNLSEKLLVKPSFNYQRASADDSKFTKEMAGFIGGKEQINSYAFSLRGDYNPIESLRIIAALRADKFSIPDDYYVSYQFAATKSFLSGKLLARAVHSRSNSGSYLGNAYANVHLKSQVPTQPPTTMSFEYAGNSEYELPTITNTEIGVRTKISNHVNTDLTLFRQNIKNIVTAVQIDSTFSAGPAGYEIATLHQFMDLPLTAVQNGITFTVNYVPNKNIQFSPFVTWQKTDVENIPTHFTTDENAENNIYSGFNDENRTTPSFYGGFYLNFIPVKKLNVNLNSYFFSSHKVYSEFELINPTTIGDIDSKAILNLKVEYRIIDNLSVYGYVRNLLNADNREQYGTDRTSSIYMAGLSYSLYK